MRVQLAREHQVQTPSFLQLLLLVVGTVLEVHLLHPILLVVTEALAVVVVITQGQVEQETRQ